MFDIRPAFVNAIEQTGSPVAPLVLQQAHTATEALGKLFTPIGNQAKTQEYMERLLKDFPEGDEAFVYDPSYIITLAAMLNQALITYGSRLCK